MLQRALRCTQGLRKSSQLNRHAQTVLYKPKMLVAVPPVQTGRDPVTGTSPLTTAVCAGDLKGFTALCDSGRWCVHELDNRGRSLLHYASWKGHAKVFQHLLDLGLGGQLSTCDNQGYTPMDDAAAKGHVHILQLVVEHPNVPKEEKEVALRRATAIKDNKTAGLNRDEAMEAQSCESMKHEKSERLAALQRGKHEKHTAFLAALQRGKHEKDTAFGEVGEAGKQKAAAMRRPEVLENESTAWDEWMAIDKWKEIAFRRVGTTKERNASALQSVIIEKSSGASNANLRRGRVVATKEDMTAATQRADAVEMKSIASVTHTKSDMEAASQSAKQEKDAALSHLDAAEKQKALEMRQTGVVANESIAWEKHMKGQRNAAPEMAAETGEGLEMVWPRPQAAEEDQTSAVWRAEVETKSVANLKPEETFRAAASQRTEHEKEQGDEPVRQKLVAMRQTEVLENGSGPWKKCANGQGAAASEMAIEAGNGKELAPKRTENITEQTSAALQWADSAENESSASVKHADYKKDAVSQQSSNSTEKKEVALRRVSATKIDKFVPAHRGDVEMKSVARAKQEKAAVQWAKHERDGALRQIEWAEHQKRLAMHRIEILENEIAAWEKREKDAGLQPTNESGEETAIAFRRVVRTEEDNTAAVLCAEATETKSIARAKRTKPERDGPLQRGRHEEDVALIKVDEAERKEARATGQTDVLENESSAWEKNARGSRDADPEVVIRAGKRMEFAMKWIEAVEKEWSARVKHVENERDVARRRVEAAEEFASDMAREAGRRMEFVIKRIETVEQEWSERLKHAGNKFDAALQSAKEACEQEKTAWRQVEAEEEDKVAGLPLAEAVETNSIARAEKVVRGRDATINWVKEACSQKAATLSKAEHIEERMSLVLQRLEAIETMTMTRFRHMEVEWAAAEQHIKAATAGKDAALRKVEGADEQTVAALSARPHTRMELKRRVDKAERSNKFWQAFFIIQVTCVISVIGSFLTLAHWLRGMPSVRCALAEFIRHAVGEIHGEGL